MKSAYHKTTPPFWPDNGVGTQTTQWQQSNCALASLLAIHHRSLGRAIAVAVEIRRGIDELTPLMAALCNRTSASALNPAASATRCGSIFEICFSST